MEVLLKKTFVLDTNVLLFDPSAFRKFGRNKVFIPLIVIEEIDRFKKTKTKMVVTPETFLDSSTI